MVRAEAFSERLPWWGGDLQTLRNTIIGESVDLSAWPVREIALALPDGDEISAQLHGTLSERPLLAIVHGLTGSAESTSVQVAARFFLKHGWAVARLNLRASPPVAEKATKLSHSGKSDDLEAALTALAAVLKVPRIALLGFSLGGNTTLKFMGEGRLAGLVAGAVSVSAPIDLAAAERAIARPRNALYHRVLVRDMKAGALAARIDPAFRKVMPSIESIYDFDNRVIAPMHGFRDAPDYYARNAARGFLGGIDRPTLLIHADNDPWIPADAYYEAMRVAAAGVRIEITPGGGHVGFHGRAHAEPWHNRRALAFLAAL